MISTTNERINCLIEFFLYEINKKKELNYNFLLDCSKSIDIIISKSKKIEVFKSLKMHILINENVYYCQLFFALIF